MFIKVILGLFILVTVHAYKQSDFRIVSDHWVLHNYSSVFLNYAYLKNVKPNRTCKTVNVGFSTKRDFTGDKFKMRIQAFQFYHNEYRPTPIIFDVKICDALEQKLFDLEMLMTRNGNVTKCPLRKNGYYIKNYDIDGTRWPPHIPRGKYQLKLSFMNGDVALAVVSLFGTIEDILKY